MKLKFISTLMISIIIFNFFNINIVKASELTIPTNGGNPALYPSYEVISVGEIVELSVANVSEKKVKWSSENKKVAKIKMGKYFANIIGVSEGETRIKATFDKKTLYYKVKVVTKEQSLEKTDELLDNMRDLSKDGLTLENYNDIPSFGFYNSKDPDYILYAELKVSVDTDDNDTTILLTSWKGKVPALTKKVLKAFLPDDYKKVYKMINDFDKSGETEFRREFIYEDGHRVNLYNSYNGGYFRVIIYEN